MKYRALDASGDYTFGNGSAVYLTGAAAVAQAIRTGIMLFLGEWWENLSLGVPMFQKILGTSTRNKASIDLILQQQILSTQGVVSLLNFNSSIAKRQYLFYVAVSTQFGPVVLTNNSLGIPNSSGITVGAVTGYDDGTDILYDDGTTVEAG